MREKLIQIRCNDEELDVIRANAKAAGKKLSPFLRDLGLSSEIKVKAFDPTNIPKPHPGDTPGIIASRSVLISRFPNDGEYSPVTESPTAKEITTLARKRWPHLPLIRAEAKIREESE